MAANSGCASSLWGHEEHSIPRVVSLDPYITSQFHHLEGRTWGAAPLPPSPSSQCTLALVNPASQQVIFPFQVAWSKAWKLCSPCVLPTSHPRRSLLGEGDLGPGRVSVENCSWASISEPWRRGSEERPEGKDATGCHELSGPQSAQEGATCRLLLCFQLSFLSLLRPLSLPKCFHSSQPLLFSFERINGKPNKL